MVHSAKTGRIQMLLSKKEICLSLRWSLLFNQNTWKLMIKNTKWPPIADWAVMNHELISWRSCLIFGWNIMFWLQRILRQSKILSFRCKVTSINDNVRQKIKPLEEVNQAVLTSFRSESSNLRLFKYIFRNSPPHITLLPSLHLFRSPVLGNCDFWTRCCLADQELLNGR